MRHFVSYFRVSTQRQGRSGLGLAAQQNTVAEYLRGIGDSKLVAQFTEVESGRDDDRPQLALALAACRIHKATLVIAKLDRLSRRLSFLGTMMESKQAFVCCDMPGANEMTVGIMASVAAGEARMISERTKLALAAAKRKGTVLGGDRGNCAQIARNGNRASAQVRGDAAKQFARDMAPILAGIRAGGSVSLRGIASKLNEQGVPARRGGAWSPEQVRAITAYGVRE